MKIMKAAIILVMGSAMILGANHVALAGRSGTEAPGAGLPIATDPSAKGLKLSGVLATHYQQIPNGTCSSEQGPDVSMTFFMRLEVGKDFYPFGSVAMNVCYWDFDAQWTAIQNFVKSDVLPFLHQQGVIDIPNACFAFKEVSDAVDDIGGNFADPSDPVFSLLNFVLAVNDRTACP